MNETDLAAIKFRQRVALDVSKRSTEMSMLGQKLPMPVALGANRINRYATC